MKKDLIIIIGAGGAAGIGMTRALKKDKSLYVAGYDNSTWAEKLQEAESSKTDVDYDRTMTIPVPDRAVLHYAEKTDTYLPSREEIMVCQDKALTAEILGGLSPKSEWVRDVYGAGGSGAKMISEYLPGRNYSCELVFWDGKLLAYFIKERLAYDLQGSKKPTHQRGSSMVSVCRDDKRVLSLALSGIAKISDYVGKPPHGVYGVDMKENRHFKLKITEINAGRFLTASYVYYYKTDYNLPLLIVNRFLDKPYKLGKYPKNKAIVRQVDSLPWLGDVGEL